MKSFEPGPDRGQLEFLPTAEREFAFLLDLGCRVVDRQVTLVRYECDSTYVNVYHARGGYQVGVEVGLLSDQNLDADLQELLAVQGEVRVDPAPAETLDEVHRQLPVLAGLFQRYGSRALRGERREFEAVRRRRRLLMLPYVDSVSASRIRAENAWESGDYDEAVEHYAEIADHLTPTEKERLNRL